MQNITIARDGNAGLTRQEWEFWFDESQGLLMLNEYRSSQRLSKRHKFQVEQNWARLHSRAWNNPLTVDDVPWPDDLANEALTVFCAHLRVVKVNPRWQ